MFEVTPEIILYEDDVLLIANKPAGLPAQGTDDPKKDHFYGALKRYLNKREHKKNVYLALHHRLDSWTSGPMIFGKKKEFNKAIADLFKEKKIEKTYLAVVEKLSRETIPKTWICEEAIKTKRQGKFLIAQCDSRGDSASTEFIVMKEAADYAIIECRPRTGRLHQIRVHLAKYHLPVWADFVYGKKKPNARMMLHSWKLSFAHPKTKKIVFIEAPIPEEFNSFINT